MREERPIAISNLSNHRTLWKLQWVVLRLVKFCFRSRASNLNPAKLARYNRVIKEGRETGRLRSITECGWVPDPAWSITGLTKCVYSSFSSHNTGTGTLGPKTAALGHSIDHIGHAQQHVVSGSKVQDPGAPVLNWLDETNIGA